MDFPCLFTSTKPTGKQEGKTSIFLITEPGSSPFGLTNGIPLASQVASCKNGDRFTNPTIWLSRLGNTYAVRRYWLSFVRRAMYRPLMHLSYCYRLLQQGAKYAVGLWFSQYACCAVEILFWKCVTLFGHVDAQLQRQSQHPRPQTPSRAQIPSSNNKVPTKVNMHHYRYYPVCVQSNAKQKASKSKAMR